MKYQITNAGEKYSSSWKSRMQEKKKKKNNMIG
jgi:hypothetical protein